MGVKVTLDEQIQMIKHWIDEQDEGIFTIYDSNEDGYEVVVKLNNGISQSVYTIFDDTMGHKLTSSQFMPNFVEVVKRGLEFAKEDLEDFINNI